MSREEIRFLADVVARPLSTTVSRYQRLSLSRRRGNAVRQHLAEGGIIEPVSIATRAGQVVLYQLSEAGRSVCVAVGLDPGPRPKESLEHRYWINKAHEHFEEKGYEITHEHPIPGNGSVDLLAQRPGEKVAIEVETGKSDIEMNLANARKDGFDRIVFIATSPAAATACQRVIQGAERGGRPDVELLTWLDVS
jgi:hypothetical protein